jgi:hypothetical protein
VSRVWLSKALSEPATHYVGTRPRQQVVQFGWWVGEFHAKYAPKLVKVSAVHAHRRRSESRGDVSISRFLNRAP